jgi:hypothetical protein
MEGMPKLRKIEVPAEKTETAPSSERIIGAESTSAPEYWNEKQELPPSRDYIGFEIRVARELAERSGKSMLEAVKEYAPTARPYLWPGTEGYVAFDELSDEEIVDAMYEKEKKYAEESMPKPYHEEMRYGCFKYHGSTDGETVDLHFSNEELEDVGPLSAEKTERRLRELSDVFTAIRKEFPQCKTVTGKSWLYNIEAYKRLYPKEYSASPEVDTDVSAVGSGRLWGQFQDSHKGLKQELAAAFLDKIRTLEEVTPEAVLAAFPYQALKVQGPVEDFYTKYGIDTH